MGRNILFVIGAYPSIGGVEGITSNLANEFTHLGNHVHIVSFEQIVDKSLMNLNENVSLLYLSKPVLSRRNRTLLREYVRSHDIDVILNQWCLPFYTTMLIKYAIRGSECKIIQVHQNDPVTNARLKKIEIDIENNVGLKVANQLKWWAVKTASRLSLRYAYNHCNQFVFLSHSFISPFLHFIWKSRSDKVCSIPESFVSTADGLLPIKGKEILYLGRIDYNQKRVVRIIDIWKELEWKYPDWRLTIVGDGPALSNVKSRAKEYGLKRVSFEGFQKPDIYFKRSPIMLLVSEYEGFGIVLAEAQSYGCVPIALDSYTALHDIITSGENGIIISYPYSKEAFVKSISKCIDNQTERERMALSAIKTVEKFKMENVLPLWLNLFKKLGVE